MYLMKGGKDQKISLEHDFGAHAILDTRGLLNKIRFMFLRGSTNIWGRLRCKATIAVAVLSEVRAWHPGTHQKEMQAISGEVYGMNS